MTNLIGKVYVQQLIHVIELLPKLSQSDFRVAERQTANKETDRLAYLPLNCLLEYMPEKMSQHKYIESIGVCSKLYVHEYQQITIKYMISST